MGVGRIDQNFCGSGEAWQDFLWDWAGLVKSFMGVGRIGQILCGSGQDWSNFLWAGFVKLSVGLGKIYQTFFRVGKAKIALILDRTGQIYFVSGQEIIRFSVVMGRLGLGEWGGLNRFLWAGCSNCLWEGAGFVKLSSGLANLVNLGLDKTGQIICVSGREMSSLFVGMDKFG